MKTDSKLPAIQFYPQDWRKDIKVQSLSFHDRAIWFEMLLLMHESEERGKLVLNGKPMTNEMIARLIGCEFKVFRKSLENIINVGVVYLDDELVLYNKRMVKDEYIRQVRKRAGGNGGNPNLVRNLVKQKDNQNDKQNSTPSISSSISSSSSNSEEQKQPPTKKEKLIKTVREKKADQLFKDSEYFDIEKFKSAFTETEYENCDLDYYYNRMKNWAESKGIRRKDWIAQARNFMLGDADKNELRLKKNIPNNERQSTGNNRNTKSEQLTDLKNLATKVLQQSGG